LPNVPCSYLIVFERSPGVIVLGQRRRRQTKSTQKMYILWRRVLRLACVSSPLNHRKPLSAFVLQRVGGRAGTVCWEWMTDHAPVWSSSSGDLIEMCLG